MLCNAVVPRQRCGHHSDEGRSLLKSEPGRPMTLGNAAKAELRLIVGCRGAAIGARSIPQSLPDDMGPRSIVLERSLIS